MIDKFRNIMYSELSFLYEAWLRVFTNQDSEAIMSKFQRKGLFEYQGLMIRALNELFRVLKPGRWITVAFHNSKNAVWNAIQEAIGHAGFVVADVRTMLIRLVPNWGFSPRRLRAAPRPSVVERVVGRRRHRGSDAEQALERVEREEPPVESERELVQVRLKVLRRDTVVNAIQPGF